MGFGAIVPTGHNVRSCHRPAGGKQRSAGTLHLECSNPIIVDKKEALRMAGLRKTVILKNA